MRRSDLLSYRSCIKCIDHSQPYHHMLTLPTASPKGNSEWFSSIEWADLLNGTMTQTNPMSVGWDKSLTRPIRNCIVVYVPLTSNSVFSIELRLMLLTRVESHSTGVVRTDASHTTRTSEGSTVLLKLSSLQTRSNTWAKYLALGGIRTHDFHAFRQMLYHWATEAFVLKNVLSGIYAIT